VDFSAISTEQDAALFELPFAFVKKEVLEARKNYKTGGKIFWKFERPRPEMRAALSTQARFLARSMVGKHQFYVWFSACVLPANLVIVFAHSDDYFFGIMQSRFHEVWSLKQGTRLETRPRYTPTTCFETFPFPFPDDLAEPLDNLEAELNAAKHYAHIVLREEPVPYRVGSSRREEALIEKSEIIMSLVTSAATKEEHRAAIAAAAKELNELRERWLNPPEWTETRTLEFPGSVTGPWSRYIDKTMICEVGRVTPCAPSDVNPDAAVGSQRRAGDCSPYQVGTVRYPRLEPRDADCAAKLKARTLTNLYNDHPAWLDLAHKKLDTAVAAAYGWNDFADIFEHAEIGNYYDFEDGGWTLLDTDAKGLAEAHEKFERDFAEKILERLLALNLERAAEKPKPRRRRSQKHNGKKLGLCC
jgi:hypothetical protein